MLTQAQIKQVREFLADKALSQRKIATITRVSRGTVAAIARGKRPDYNRSGPPAGEDRLCTGPTARCPECGGKVITPCKACRLRLILALSTPEPTQDPESDVELALDLKGEIRARYEAISFRPDSPAASHDPRRPGRPNKHGR